MASAGPHPSSKTVGYLADCPSETQMFRLLSNAAFLGPIIPWMLALPRHKYFQTEPQHFCVQLCLNICQILSSSGGNKAEECACDYIAHKQGLTRTRAPLHTCTTSRKTHTHTAWRICVSESYNILMSAQTAIDGPSHIFYVHTKRSWSRTLVH